MAAIIEGQNSIWKYIKSMPNTDGGVLMPSQLTFHMDELPGCCGIRTLRHFTVKTENLIVGGPLDAKVFGNYKLKVQQESWDYKRHYGNYSELINKIPKQEHQKTLESMFESVLELVDEFRLHQFILTDQITHNDPAECVTRYFVEWLIKNRHGKIQAGPVTFNGNYLKVKTTFVRTWIWIPPSKPVLHIKHSKVVGIPVYWANVIRTNILVTGLTKNYKPGQVKPYLKSIGWSWEAWTKKNTNTKHKYLDRFDE